MYGLVNLIQLYSTTSFRIGHKFDLLTIISILAYMYNIITNMLIIIATSDYDLEA
jgi:hypothetical protein